MRGRLSGRPFPVARKGVSRAEPLIAAKAKENQKAGGQSREVGRQMSDKPLDTQKEAAALGGVSHDTGRKGKTVLAGNFYVEVYGVDILCRPRTAGKIFCKKIEKGVDRFRTRRMLKLVASVVQANGRRDPQV